MNVQIESSWKNILTEELEKEYFLELTKKIRSLHLSNETTVYPPAGLIFNAFHKCPFKKVKVVILGQDPYHNIGQAHGLSFSVPDGTQIPPSLQNIYKEINNTINTSINCVIPVSGNLEHWTKQGVLLLNSTLTVEAHKAGSHQGLGWERFTDTVIQKISDKKEHVVFLLWGTHAKEKGKNIDTTKHLVLTAPHPSPLSAYRGFLGCKHFQKTNNYLKEHKITEISW